MANLTKVTVGVSTLSQTQTLLNQVVDHINALEKANGAYTEDHTPADAPEVTPNTVTIGGKYYTFNPPSFKWKGTTYGATAIVASPSSYTTLLTELVAAQTVDGVFQSGGLLTKQTSFYKES